MPSSLHPGTARRARVRLLSVDRDQAWGGRVSQSRSRRPPRHRVRRSGVQRRSIITIGGGSSNTATTGLSWLMAGVSVRDSPR